VWDVGQWDTATWAEAVQERTLAEDLVDAIRARQGKPIPEGIESGALLEALARHPLIVTSWVAVPAVRMAVAGLRVTPEGRRARQHVFPHLRTYALRRALSEVAPKPDADYDVYAVARRLHTRAMAHMVDLLRRVSEDPEAFANIIEHAPPRQRDLLLLDNLGPAWRAQTAMILGVGRGAVRTRRHRHKHKRDVASTE
jgi:hypothetical protein